MRLIKDPKKNDLEKNIENKKPSIKHEIKGAFVYILYVAVLMIYNYLPLPNVDLNRKSVSLFMKLYYEYSGNNK